MIDFSNKCKKNIPFKEIKYLAIPILLFIILLGSSFMDIFTSKEQTLLNVATQNKNYLNLFVKNSITEEANNIREEEEIVIRQIEENFPTTSSTFMIVYRGEEPVFIRDSMLTKKISLLDKKELNKFKVMSKKNLSKNTENLYDVVLNNKEEYIVSYTYLETNSESLLIGICNKKAYLVKRYFFNLLYTHFIFYLVVFAVITIAIITALIYKKNEITIEKEYWKDSFTSNRKIIDELEVRLLEKPKYNTDSLTSGYLPTIMVEDLIDNLTQTQRKKTIRIVLDISKATQETYINLVACLEKKKMDNCISCMHADSELQIVLLNCKKEVAENYLAQLFLFYKQYFGPLDEYVTYSIDYLGE